MKTLSEFRFDPKEEKRQCKRCFMTGKSCIYQREIERELSSSEIRPNQKITKSKAFMLMPFRSILDQVYRAQIEPCLRDRFPIVGRADDIMRTGFVVCEKICKQIQESQLIAAEISTDNHNVFYELGMSYALEKDIALLIQESVKDKRREIIEKLNLGENYNTYWPFAMLSSANLKLWQRDTKKSIPQKDDILILLADRTPVTEYVDGYELNYTVDQLCRGAVHRAISISRTRNNSLWAGSKTRTITVTESGYEEDSQKINFERVEDAIRARRCVIIGTSESEPCSYFWLGFSHGLEKDVIPITVVQEKKDNAKDNDPPKVRDNSSYMTSEATALTNLPFDIRALWHIFFKKNEPDVLETQLQSILNILSDKDSDTKQRRTFWDEILQAGSVSIFVGSVELTTNGRHVVGEWDYRTVSELSGFFSSLKETMETIIQTPIFQASANLAIKHGNQASKILKHEITRLTSLLEERNSIIIASADVNDMTELALAKAGGIEPFSGAEFRDDPDFNGIVGFKHESAVTFETPSVYFKTISPASNKNSETKDTFERGFYDVRGGHFADKPKTKFSSVYTPYNNVTEDKYSVLYAHLAKFELPNKRWSIVLQGISGPATLGVAQMLTGAKYRQFTVFSQEADKDEILYLLKEKIAKSDKSPSLKEFYKNPDNENKLPDMEIHSETMAREIHTAMRESSVECIVSIFVKDGGDPAHDERKIIWWDFALHPRTMATPN